MIVAFAPGGGTDMLARAVAKQLTVSLAQSIIVENKPGAATVIGAEYVARAKPDGYTLLVTSAPHVSNPSLVPLPFDTLTAFAPVCLAAQSPFVFVVRPDSPIHSLDDLVSLSKTKKLTFGSSGNGTNDHLATELLSIMYGISMVHVPYKGTGPAMLDLLGGHIDLMLGNIVGAAPFLQSGKLRAIAVTTKHRAALLPDVPTLAELSGKPFDVSAWTGILAPAGTDPQIVAQLNREILKALDTTAVKEVLATNGAEAVGGSPADFQNFIASEIPKWAEIIQRAGIRVN
jgi:tripartite-type tricarboxylate transporter receptor subunit TctC